MNGGFDTATSPDILFANGHATVAHPTSNVWLGQPRDMMTSGVHSRAVIWKRDLSDGAIAGVVIGIFVAVALLAFCLYPVVIYLIKRRKRRRSQDVEAENEYGSSNNGSAGGPGHHRRLSSTDSLKHHEQLSRGGFDGNQGHNIVWTSADGALVPVERSYGLPGQSSMRTEPSRHRDGSNALAAAVPRDYEAEEMEPFPFYMPASMPDENPGVLKGTSADYYSPSIPSEAFGMTSTQETKEVTRTLSRGSSFRHSLKHILRRQSGRAGTLASLPSVDAEPAPENEPERILTEYPFEAQLETSPTANPATRPPDLPASPPSSPDDQVAVPSPHTVRPVPAQKPRLSHYAPLASAPGTVNPMDIMAPSTESEVWHHTEHELSTCNFTTPNDQSEFDNLPSPERMHISASPSLDTTQTIRPATPTEESLPDGLKVTGGQDVSIIALHSHEPLSDSINSGSARHPSYTSDQSTPFATTHSSGPSTENTPSTQLDSPSPRSVISSEFRSSSSPQPIISSSHTTGLYRCDEAGCGQTFQHPHKLR